MGIWGPQSSQNDDAADWLSEFQEQPSLPLLKKAILRAAKAKATTYLEVTDGAEAIVASDILAQLLGHPGKPPVLDKDTAAVATEKLRKGATADIKELVKQAPVALQRILANKNSELQQLWEEDPKGKLAWTKRVRDLAARLKKINSASLDRLLKPPTLAEPKFPKKKASKRQPYKVGLIVAIPLPDHQFAYAKVFNDSDFGVYDFLTDKIEPLEKVVKNKVSFFGAATDSAIKKGEWPVIGEESFPDEESAWAPPMASGVFPGFPLDDGVLHIDHKGDSRRAASPKEAAGMDIRGFAQRPELFINKIVDRLVKGNHAKYRVRI